MGTREELLRLRGEVAASVATLSASLRDLFAASTSSNADDEHDPEGATIAFERAQLSAVLSGERQRLADLDAAVGRLAAGTYGNCSQCGNPIPWERLAILPSTSTCVSCAASSPRRR